MGKAPVLVTPQNMPIAESSAILAYLIDTYDKEGRFAAQDKIRDESLTSFAGSTIGTIGMIELIFEIVAEKSPWPLSILLGGVKSNIHKSFTGPEYAVQFGYLEEQLTDVWFNGKNLGRSDVMLSWPMDFLAAKKYVEFEKYPKILQWRKKVQEREAWKRAMEKGNGYELAKV
jgi:glutathione S-transferase